ncbi:MAG: DsbE family thiol:disulfide interchange protein [Rhizobiaceae bacterium]|nr:MAG: DsbE family thiol:disulfide interchange protein [Rhizobiaceae bacterium]CAG0957243.1 Thiol:disulfide interchange protein CycY [Rhizobiaceae bacterium]
MSERTESVRRPRRLVVLLPLIVFALLAGVFLLQLLSGRDGSVVPSALIGQPAPKTALDALDGLGVPGLDSAAFAGRVTVLNIFASWCAPCREEHPVLLALAADGRFALSGLNYKDEPGDARGFLGELGNPFGAIGVDPAGRAAIEWGVYGVPETFVIGKDGTILFKHVGPLTEESVRAQLMPIIERALADGATG